MLILGQHLMKPWFMWKSFNLFYKSFKKMRIELLSMMKWIIFLLSGLIVLSCNGWYCINVGVFTQNSLLKSLIAISTEFSYGIANREPYRFILYLGAHISLIFILVTSFYSFFKKMMFSLLLYGCLMMVIHIEKSQKSI